MKLIWHADGLQEADWLREIFGSSIEAEVNDVDMNYFDDNGVHVISSNWEPLTFYESYFEKLRSSSSKLILFHASDEYFSGGYKLYRHFDLVIRNFQSYLTDHPGILTIPEGYSNGLRARGSHPRAEMRKYAWSFAGEIKTSRIEMRDAMEGFGPSFLTATGSISATDRRQLSKSEYAELLRNTTFSPCPMGNAILETWRCYESLEMGCIPLLEKRTTLDYFTRLFGSHPIPAFESWSAARLFAESLYADKTALVEKQRAIGAWWIAHKEGVRAMVRSMIDGPSHAKSLQEFAEFPRNRHRLVHEPLRLAELMRHQTLRSFSRRVANPMGPMRRIVRDGWRRDKL